MISLSVALSSSAKFIMEGGAVMELILGINFRQKKAQQ
jgi:hypothetical protein